MGQVERQYDFDFDIMQTRCRTIVAKCVGVAFMPTYTKLPKNLSALKGVVGLYGRHKNRIARELPSLVEETRDAMTKIEALYGRELRALEILDVGPGPFLLQSTILGMQNDVTAMDLDVVPVGFDPAAYWQMFRRNGGFRALKTLARKCMGIDREYRRQLSAILNSTTRARIRFIQGDATNSGLPDASFAIIYCRALFQHLRDPEAATREFGRLLRPGGVLYVSLHLYTSFNGSLDPRVAYGHGDESLHWAHLRPSLRSTVSSEATQGKLKLSEWIDIFTRVCPGHLREVHNSTREDVPEVADRLIKAGEIQGYSKEELCAHTLDIFWKKPITLVASERA
jgi:SAM-dependent methyltransferase